MVRLCFILLFATVTHLGQARPPNLVLIIADDQSWTDFGFMGNERVHTPRLDALAAGSARFVNGYVPSSVCRPSLVSLLTGRYPHQHGVHFNHGPPGNSGYNQMQSRAEYEATRSKEFALIRQQKTLPGILRDEAGYRSLQTGKFWEGHWRNGGFTEGMTTFEAPPVDQTFGGLRRLRNGDRVAHGNGDLGLQIGRRTMSPIRDFVQNCEAEKTPWLVWYAPYLPHQPHDSPARFYERAAARPGVATNELPYFAAIAEFDETVGTLIDLVSAHAAMSNTVFVFVSDNGWQPSRRRQPGRPVEYAYTKTSKRAPFDAGLRTPILIRWDGVVSPATHHGLVSSIDIVPTLLAAAGKEHKLPGRDLLPVARGAAALDPDRAIFGAIYPGDATSLDDPARDLAYRWVRQGRYKLIVPKGPKPWGNYLRRPALFDLQADPHEQQDLAANPAHADTIVELRRRLDAWWSGE